MTASDDRIEAQIALCARAPRMPGPQAVLARLLLEAGRAAEAIAAAEAALAIDPRHAAAKAARRAAGAAIATMDPALATRELSAALKADDAGAQLDLAHAYVSLQRPIDAERLFKRALVLDPESADAHAGLSALYLNAGIDDGAEHHSRRALQIKPAQAVASQTLSTLLQARGDHALAAAVLDAAYARQSLFAEPAPASPFTVLVLATQSNGNIPYRHLMPAHRYSRVVWYMEHAKADQAPPPYDVVFNAIGDPDLAKAGEAAVAAFLKVNRRPVLNDPARIGPTRRDRLPGLLAGIEGVLAPPAARLDLGHGLQAALGGAGLSPPLLLRPTGSHGGRGLARADDAQALAALAAAFAEGEGYATQYCDYRSPDGRYRKGRMIFVDRTPYPYHWAISDHWLVHYESAGMDRDHARQAEEARFLTDPAGLIGAGAMAAITEIGRRLDLDYCGLDFSLLPDGRVLVFEANATMLVHPEPETSPLAYKNPPVGRILSAFQDRLAALAR